MAPLEATQKSGRLPPIPSPKSSSSTRATHVVIDVTQSAMNLRCEDSRGSESWLTSTSSSVQAYREVTADE
jgi:hypothetical protein